ncbi:hypothetical protein SCF23_16415 [Methanospirillum hungatei]|nr:hypothetical protein [Methanospirillum sp. J.3.6.1-F.2.7.3]MDX8551968.1 hypothetical protein [Methanospirillum hungatei]
MLEVFGHIQIYSDIHKGHIMRLAPELKSDIDTLWDRFWSGKTRG